MLTIATWPNIPEDAILYSHCCENLKSYNKKIWFALWNFTIQSIFGRTQPSPKMGCGEYSKEVELSHINLRALPFRCTGEGKCSQYVTSESDADESRALCSRCFMLCVGLSFGMDIGAKKGNNSGLALYRHELAELVVIHRYGCKCVKAVNLISTINIYIYIYIYMCVCVCKYKFSH
jgi:hypothetical protein